MITYVASADVAWNAAGKLHGISLGDSTCVMTCFNLLGYQGLCRGDEYNLAVGKPSVV